MKKPITVLILGWVIALAGLTAVANAQQTVDCEQAGQAAEQAFGLPAGLLLAIGRVESGRWSAGLQRTVSWPWSIDVDGTAHIFDNLDEAKRALLGLAGGRHSIDVGCFQISLLYHPDAFADSEQAFDPVANADYAARFLVSLKDRLGSWRAAVAAYHSADPSRGGPYGDRVFATWSHGTVPTNTAPVGFAAVPGMQVWTPSPAGTALAVIKVQAASYVLLPRIITPTR